ncbi:hypothetical protein P154DRAFT_518280 [Amniculicola lignicola CBS 123094]|uniref:F-box domain-containing protein n=1 Tax=Amniculicola lignicola CBS 123094 TaxID=1392246 RepID=A0A6A5WWE8_9PLEO|nr:hypothetical protein P154DRAFT_518280 [Amniculicola lignicola CBS 123094]
MSLLLALPRELRDNIIEHVHLSKRHVPTTLKELRATHREPVCNDWHFISRKQTPFFNFTDSATPSTSCAGLLLTNKQLHSETKATIKRLSKNDIEYELDVKVLQDTAFFLTWVRIPVICRTIHRLKVNVQTVAIPEQLPGTYKMIHSDGMSYLMPIIFALLDRLTSSRPKARSPRAINPLWITNFDLSFLNAPKIVTVIQAAGPPSLWSPGSDIEIHEGEGEDAVVRGPMQLCDYAKAWFGKTKDAGVNSEAGFWIRLANMKLVTLRVGERIEWKIDM